MTHDKELFFSSETILLCFLAVFALVSAWNYGSKSPADDFYQFWAIGRALTTSTPTNIYAEADRRRIGERLYRQFKENGASPPVMKSVEYRRVLEIYSTPFLYTMFSLGSWGDYESNLRFYRISLLGIAALALVALCRFLNWSFSGTMLLVIVCGTWFGPLMADVEVGNVNSIQLGLLALFLRFVKRPDRTTNLFLAGLVLGFTVMFKPNVVFVAGLLAASWVIGRRFRELGIVALGAGIAATFAVVLSSLVFLSARCWLDWLAALQTMPDDIISTQMGNYALARILFDVTGVRWSLWLVLLTNGAALLCLWQGCRKESHGSGGEPQAEIGRDRDYLRDALMVAVGCLIYLLSAPLAWIHYFLLTLPMLVISFRPFDSHISRTGAVLFRRVLATVALIGLAVHPLAALYGVSDPRFFAVTFSGSTLVLFGLALWELVRLGRTGEPSMGS